MQEGGLGENMKVHRSQLERDRDTALALQAARKKSGHNPLTPYPAKVFHPLLPAHPASIPLSVTGMPREVASRGHASALGMTPAVQLPAKLPQLLSVILRLRLAVRSATNQVWHAYGASAACKVHATQRAVLCSAEAWPSPASALAAWAGAPPTRASWRGPRRLPQQRRLRLTLLR